VSGPFIRTATVRDADAVIVIEAEAFGPASWGPQALRAGLLAPHARALVVEDADGSIEGFLLWRRIGEEAEILSLAVRAPSRRCGVAKALLAELILETETERVRSIFLEVEAGNAAARALYNSARFEQVGLRRKYYRSGADALVLRRAVGAPI